jgi:hypothetical protein
MNICDEITRARNCGYVYCGVTPTRPDSAVALAAEFDLVADATDLREVDGVMAVRLARFVLHRDLAYRDEIMTSDRAGELAERFLAQFAGDGVRFYTNGHFREEGGAIVSLERWNPLTKGTLDTGVLVVGEGTGGCLWVQDED